jgi:hypothetical protein
MPRNLNAPETTPNNGPVFSSSSTPRASIYRYNTSYVASPDGTNAPSTPTLTARPTQLRPTTPYMGATLTQRHLLSRPATPPTVQSPNKSYLPSSPLSRPLASIDKEEEEEEEIEDHRPGVVEYVLHTGSCFAKTLMTVAYGIALMDVKCLAAGRNLFNSISNNYKVDKLLFALTCAAILFSLTFVLSTTTSTPKYSPILSTVDLESQITEAINNRMQIIQNQLRTGKIFLLLFPLRDSAPYFFCFQKKNRTQQTNRGFSSRRSRSSVSTSLKLYQRTTGRQVCSSG